MLTSAQEGSGNPLVRAGDCGVQTCRGGTHLTFITQAAVCWELLKFQAFGLSNIIRLLCCFIFSLQAMAWGCRYTHLTDEKTGSERFLGFAKVIWLVSGMRSPLPPLTPMSVQPACPFQKAFLDQVQREARPVLLLRPVQAGILSCTTRRLPSVDRLTSLGLDSLSVKQRS